MIEQIDMPDFGTTSLHNFNFKFDKIHSKPDTHQIVIKITIKKEIIEELRNLSTDALFINFRSMLTGYEKIFENKIDYERPLEDFSNTMRLDLNCLGDSVMVKIIAFDSNNERVALSIEKQIRIDKPKLNFDIKWISFKGFKRFCRHKYLFWVIDLSNDENPIIFFNQDYIHFEEFLNSKRTQFMRNKKFFMGYFSMNLFASFQFSAISPSLQDENFKTIIVDNLDKENYFLKLNSSDETLDDSNQISAIYPFLDSEKHPELNSDRWLWLADFYQKPILSILKELINEKFKKIERED